MQLLGGADTTTLSYWLTWRFLLCATWVFTSMFIAAFLIWKYEHLDHSEFDEDETEQKTSWVLRADITWRPCVKEMHPLYLMVFRIVAFCLLFAAVALDLVIHGSSLFYYYTQWTFVLVTFYFAFGSLLSIYGCYQHHKTNCRVNDTVEMDAEQGLYTSLTNGGKVKGVKLVNNLDYQRKPCFLLTAGFWAYFFQVLYQMTAGAVMLTDIVYWSIIFPFLTIRV